MSDTRFPSNLRLAAAALTIVVVVALAYGDVLSQSWLYDDAFHLVYVTNHTPAEYFTAPGAWRELPFRMYTPLQMVSFELDLALGGYKPRVFYIHALILLVVAGWMVFAVFRRFVGDLRALFVTIAFLLGPAIGEWGRVLMARHYLEGFCFAAVSFYLVVEDRRSRLSGQAELPVLHQVLAALLYFVAMLFKEVFVLLPAFIALVPGLGRIKRLIPFAVALLAYLALRFYMLGTLGGGYGWAVRPRRYPEVIAAMPAKLWSVMTGSEWTIVVALLLALIVIAMSALRVHLWRLAVAALLAVAPVVPVATTVERRYAGLLWMVGCVAIALATEALDRRVMRSAVLTFLVILVAAVAMGRYRDWNRWNEHIARMSAESNAVLRLGAGDVLAMPVTPPAAIVSLKNLKENVLRAGAAPRWFYDPIVVCEQSDVAKGAVWEVNETTVTRTNPATEWSSFCSSIRGGPMNALFTKEGGSLFWDLEPDDGVTWTFILGDAQQAFEMPAHSGFQVGNTDQLSLRLRYRTGSGSVTYSPPLQLDFRNGPTFEWRQ